MPGYLSAEYAESFAEWGTVLPLPRSGGWLLKRAIPGSDHHDAMGPYPVFCCRNWAGLGADLDALSDHLIGASLVTDPFCPLDEEHLRRLFDHVIPYKPHYIADLSLPVQDYVSKSRYRSAHKLLPQLEIEVLENPQHLVEEWITLQLELSGRHSLAGVRALSEDAIRRLFRVPGAVVMRAVHEDLTVGMHVDLMQGDVVYAHLAAYSARGYRIGASTALNVFEIEYFASRARWMSWGGVSGIEADTSDGLGVFKRRFSSNERMVYLCGKILNRHAYARLAKDRKQIGSNYFPAYRAGERI